MPLINSSHENFNASHASEAGANNYSITPMNQIQNGQFKDKVGQWSGSGPLNLALTLTAEFKSQSQKAFQI